MLHEVTPLSGTQGSTSGERHGRPRCVELMAVMVSTSPAPAILAQSGQTTDDGGGPSVVSPREIEIPPPHGDDDSFELRVRPELADSRSQSGTHGLGRQIQGIGYLGDDQTSG